MYFDGELTFGGDSSQTKNEQDHQAPPKKISSQSTQSEKSKSLSPNIGEKDSQPLKILKEVDETSNKSRSSQSKSQQSVPTPSFTQKAQEAESKVQKALNSVQNTTASNSNSKLQNIRIDDSTDSLALKSTAATTQEAPKPAPLTVKPL